jgi:hypothetical protein
VTYDSREQLGAIGLIAILLVLLVLAVAFLIETKSVQNPNSGSGNREPVSGTLLARSILEAAGKG